MSAATASEAKLLKPPIELVYSIDSHTNLFDNGNSKIMERLGQSWVGSPNRSLESSATIKPSLLSIRDSSVTSGQRMRLKSLKEGWAQEARNHASYLTCASEVVSPIIEETLNYLSKIKFEGAAVEFVPSDALKVTLLLRREPELLLVVTRPFYELIDVRVGQVVFSIFNQEDRISHVLPLSALVESISAFLAEQEPAESR